MEVQWWRGRASETQESPPSVRQLWLRKSRGERKSAGREGRTNTAPSTKHQAKTLLDLRDRQFQRADAEPLVFRVSTLIRHRYQRDVERVSWQSAILVEAAQG